MVTISASKSLCPMCLEYIYTHKMPVPQENCRRRVTFAAIIIFDAVVFIYIYYISSTASCHLTKKLYALCELRAACRRSFIHQILRLAAHHAVWVRNLTLIHRGFRSRSIMFIRKGNFRYTFVHMCRMR